MSIVVDSAVQYPSVSEEARRRGHANKAWCHMTSDTSMEELHAFAIRLGLRREWFQNDRRHPHYDLTEGKRRQAVTLGAKEVTRSELAGIWKRFAESCADAYEEVKP